MQPSRYITRVVEGELDELLAAVPAVAIEGARGVGKTSTAERRARTVIRLDDPAQYEVARAAPERLTAGEPPILIDEWQRLPEAWDVVRREVDRGGGAGRFILTGSAVPTNAPSHSGAGRIVTVRMRPLSIAERGMGSPAISLRDLLSVGPTEIVGRTAVTLEDYVDEIVRSGLPGVRHLSNMPLRAQLDGYLTRVAERDFAEQGHQVRRPETLMRLVRAYAAATATTASLATIRRAAAADPGEVPAATTTQAYIDVLESLWILDRVEAWAPTRNRIRRLSLPSKHHLVDPALAARLLGVGAAGLLEGDDPGPPIPRDGALLGSLFESLVTQSVRVYAQAAEAQVRHLRTAGGDREVDLIVERDDGRVVAIEVKLARTPNDADVRHLLWLRDRLGDDLLDAVVISTGPEAYRRDDGVAVIPAALLGP